MDVETIKREIDGHEVEVTQFFAVRGFKIKQRVYKLILPVLGEFIGGAKGDIKEKDFLDADIDMQAVFPKAIAKVAETVDVKQFFELLIDLFASTFVNGKQLDEKYFNKLFVGKYNLVYKIAYAVVDINNFFDLGGIGSQLRDKLRKKTPVSPEKSTK